MTSFELRLAALSKLISVKTPEVNSRLSEAFGRAVRTLHDGCEYQELLEALKTVGVLVPRFHMAILPELKTFVRSIKLRSLSDNAVPIATEMLRFKSPENLIREAIDVAARVRYIHTEQLIDFLLEVSAMNDGEVKAEAERCFEDLATFNMDVFYGDPPRGAEPQARTVGHLSNLKDEVLRANANLILKILRTLLSPAIEGTTWSFNSITIRRGPVASDGGVSDMRAAAIKLAERMYGLDEDVAHRERVLRTLDAATRREVPTSDTKTGAMFERDAVNVLEFMRGLVGTEALPLVQAIEHQAYWDYYHAVSQVVKDKALEVRDAVAAHDEYQIYKQLIGFEGIFGNWADLSRSDEAWDYTDTKRREAADRYLSEIDAENCSEWRDRILRFSETRSDDLATFPVYYYFLESVGRQKPDLAIELLTNHEEMMRPFLIPLIRGLWVSASQDKIGEIVNDWITEGRNLGAVAKSLYDVGQSRLSTLSSVVARASDLDDRGSLIEAMGVAANLHDQGALEAKSIFMQSLRQLAARGDARWVVAVWFRKELKTLISAMEPGERTETMESLLSLAQIDYQAEEVLYEIAQHDVAGVLRFMVARLKQAREFSKQKHGVERVDVEQFEPVPYQLHKLGKLLATSPVELLSALRRDFDDEVRYLFSYRAARLAKSAFPNFEGEIELALLPYVEQGKVNDLEFVIAILRAYDGAAATMKVCKLIIEKAEERSKVWNEVAAIIETSGVVYGEYGLVQAYERKLEQIAEWATDESERVRAFAKWLSEGLHRLIEQERQRANEELALRKYRHGENGGEE